jgi:hypothetical protein
MQPPTALTHGESPYPLAAPPRADPRRLAGRWPFPAVTGASAELRRAALDVLRITARDWGLAPRW